MSSWMPPLKSKFPQPKWKRRPAHKPNNSSKMQRDMKPGTWRLRFDPVRRGYSLNVCHSNGGSACAGTEKSYRHLFRTVIFYAEYYSYEPESKADTHTLDQLRAQAGFTKIEVKEMRQRFKKGDWFNERD